MTTDKPILDACCGSRMFWFNKHEPHTIYMDIREESLTLCDGRTTEVKPDVIADCRDTPFPDNTFNLIIFDPPHLKWVGRKQLDGTQVRQVAKGLAEVPQRFYG